MNKLLYGLIILVCIMQLIFETGLVHGSESESILLEAELEKLLFKDIETHREPMALSHQSLAGIVLNQSTFEDVERVFGATRRISLGHGGLLMCYRSANPKDRTIVTFSGGVMNVPTVFSFQLISRVEDYKGKAQCGVSGLVSRKLRTASGLGLDFSQHDFELIWGGPTTKIENHLLARYLYTQLVKQESQELCVSTFSDMRSRFRTDKLSWLLIETVEEADFNVSACHKNAAN